MAIQILSDFIAKEGWPASARVDRESAVARLEHRNGIILPEDFRDYVVTLCPDEDQMDDHSTTWWGINAICNVRESFENGYEFHKRAGSEGKYLLFADALAWCWGWAIACTDDERRGEVIVVSDAKRVVAPSFSAFIEGYVVDWRTVS